MKYIKHLFTKHALPAVCILAVVAFAIIYFVRANDQSGYGSITVVKDIENPEEVPANFLVDNFYMELSLGGEQVGFEAIYPPNPDPNYINQFEFSNLTPGDYTIFEWVHSNWDFVGVSCDNGFESDDPTLSFTLAANENVTCTFTNVLRKSSITVYKVADTEDEFEFQLNGPTPSSQIIQGTGSFTFSDLTPSYTRTSYPNGLENSLPYTLIELGEGVSPVINCISDLAIVRSRDYSPEIEYIQDGNAVEVLLLPGENLACYFNNTDLSLISGQKFHDLDADTQRASRHDHDYDEPFLSDWNINLYKYNEAAFEYQLENGVLTDLSGYYLFPHLVTGNYRLCEDTEPDFTQSFPVWMGENDPGSGSCGDINNEFTGHDFSIGERENSIGYDFGNFRNATITVRKFDDLNFNGIFDDGESLLSDWPINLLSNGSFEAYFEANTGEDGTFSFGIPSNQIITPGGWELCEGSRRGEDDHDWLQTYPALEEDEEDNGGGGCHSLTVFSGDDLTFDFGNFDGSLITGFKFNDLNGDGSWYQYGESEQLVEPGISDWPIALGKVGEFEEGQPIPIEIVAMTLTSVDGSFSLPVRESGQYKVFEGARAGFQATTPSPSEFPVDSFFDITYRIETPDISEDLRGTNLNTDSFFFVFVEGLGERIEYDGGQNRFWFGNYLVSDEPVVIDIDDLPNLFGLGLISVERDEDDNINKVIFSNETQIRIPQEDGESLITLPGGLEIMRADGGTIDPSQFTAGELDPNSLSGLGSGTVAEGALEWGMPNLGLTFTPAITLQIFVGEDLNGRTLDILRSPDGVTWISDGIVPPATCLVANGLCEFQATKASSYAATQTTTTTTSSSSGSSGGYWPQYKPVSPVIVQAPAISPAIPGAAVKFFNRNLAYSSKGEDVRELQKYLNTHGFPLASTGYGSPGQETDVFGPLTRAALIRFQEANATQILKPYGLTRGTGVFGVLTRNLVNSLK